RGPARRHARVRPPGPRPGPRPLRPRDRRAARLDGRRPARLARRGGRVAEYQDDADRHMSERQYTLDPVTFEVLKNAFITIVDEMAEQILRTCYSFVIYARDFSSALCDREGNTIMQGSQDIAVHVGTLHFTCKAIIDAFGDDVHPGDVF